MHTLCQLGQRGSIWHTHRKVFQKQLCFMKMTSAHLVIIATQDETSVQLKPEFNNFPGSIKTEKIALNFRMHLKPSARETIKRLTNCVTSTNTEYTANTSTALKLNLNTKQPPKWKFKLNICSLNNIIRMVEIVSSRLVKDNTFLPHI